LCRDRDRQPAETVPPGLASLIKQTLAQSAPNTQPIGKAGVPADIAAAAQVDEAQSG